MLGDFLLKAKNPQYALHQSWPKNNLTLPNFIFFLPRILGGIPMVISLKTACMERVVLKIELSP